VLRFVLFADCKSLYGEVAKLNRIPMGVLEKSHVHALEVLIPARILPGDEIYSTS